MFFSKFICSGRIYDRNNESDIDITDNEELVYKLYARKQGTYFVNKVLPEWGMDLLKQKDHLNVF